MSESHSECLDPCPVIALREPVEEVAALLRWLQFGLLRHPGLVRPLVRSLIAEGTRFAETEAGREWNDRIEGSDMIKEMRTYWGVVDRSALWSRNGTGRCDHCADRRLHDRPPAGAIGSGPGRCLSRRSELVTDPLLYGSRKQFSFGDDCLPALLGVLALPARLRAIVDLQVSAARAEAEVPLPKDLRCFVLGLASLLDQLSQRIDQEVGDPRRPPSGAPGRRPTSPVA